jgi:hypothetical protein
MTNPVICRISCDRPDDESHKQPSQVKEAGCGTDACNKEKRIAGKIRGDDKSGLKKNDHEQYQVGQEPVILNYQRKILVDM